MIIVDLAVVRHLSSGVSDIIVTGEVRGMLPDLFMC